MRDNIKTIIKLIVIASCVCIIILSLTDKINLTKELLTFIALTCLIAVIPIENIDKIKFGSLSFELKEKLEQQEKQISIQRNLIDTYVLFSVGSHIYGLLTNIFKAQQNNTEYILRNDYDNDQKILFLSDHGFIQIIGKGSVPDLYGKDVRKSIEITPAGEIYLKMREGYFVYLAVKDNKSMKTIMEEFNYNNEKLVNEMLICFNGKSFDENRKELHG